MSKLNYQRSGKQESEQQNDRNNQHKREREYFLSPLLVILIGLLDFLERSWGIITRLLNMIRNDINVFALELDHFVDLIGDVVYVFDLLLGLC